MKEQLKKATKKGSFGSDAIWVMVVKVAGAAMTIALSVFITRVIGKGAYGLVSLGNQLLNFSLLLVLSGYNQITTREVSKMREDRTKVSLFASMLHKYVFKRSAAMMLILMGLAYPLFAWTFNSDSFILPFIILAVGFVPQTVSRIYSSILLGMKKVWQANLTEQTLTSTLTLLFLLVLYGAGWAVDVWQVVFSFVAARTVMYLVFSAYMRRGMDLNIKFSHSEGSRITEQEGFSSSASRRSFLIIALTSYAYNTVNSLVLGYTSTAVDVGVFNILMKIATPIAFILIAFQRSSMPRIAKKYAEGNLKYLKNAFLKIGVLAGALGLLFFLLVYFFGPQILTVWNIEEREVYWALVVLSLGFLINAATSVAGPILAMTGREFIHSIINVVSIILQIVASFGLSWKYGLIGAAWSYTLVMLFSNVAKVYFMYLRVFRVRRIDGAA